MLAAEAILGLLALGGGAQDDKTFQPAIRKFQDDFYKPGARDDDRISAVNVLAQYRHERIVRTLAPLLTESTLPVRIMTARALAQFTGVDAAPRELLVALRSQANAGRKAPAVRIELLRGLGQLRYSPAAAEISRSVDDPEVWVAKAAIDAAGRLRCEEAIDPLIRALRRIEGREGDAEIGINPLDSLFPEMVTRSSLLKPDARQTQKRPSERETLKAPILAALESITKQSLAAARDWESWWTRNKATFRVME